jgi:hypothetical protein
MALEKFRHPPLPNPPTGYDPQYIRQLIRVLELYFGQLDSLTPNQAQSYRADFFYGGAFVAGNYTTTEKDALTPRPGMVVFDTTLGKLSVYTGAAWETVTSA